MPKHSTWIIKLGGSLIGSPHLGAWLQEIGDAGARHRIVVVPGGGVFADAVRTAQGLLGFDDALAHSMAVQGMRQFGTALAALTVTPGVPGLTQLAEITTNVRAHGLWIWDPCDPRFARCHLPRDWRVTSDSISLWLAGNIPDSCLLLVKSRKPHPDTASDIAALSDAGYIDDYFPLLWSRCARPAWWLECTQLNDLKRLFGGSPMPGHVIGNGAD